MWHERQLLIDGKLVDAADGAVFPTINPATEEVLGTAADAGPTDAAAAVAAARRAFDTTDWSRDHAFRAHCLRQLHEALTFRIEEMRSITVAEAGAPVLLTRGGPQLEAPVEMVRWHADLLDSYDWTEDLGVAESVYGSHRRWITTHPDVDMVSFTGSTVVGRRVMASASATVKRVFLELGGKSAYVVLDDADVATVGLMAAAMVCTHAGQGCAITIRLVVPAAMHDTVVDAVAATLDGMPYGDPADESHLTGRTRAMNAKRMSC